MRESNFNLPAHNRACVCISSSLYDRRALDAPAASLPLVNSLTHLSYLTATSARIRESLSSDGGLERLVRILQNCANPTSVQVGTLSDLKGKGRELPRTRKARQSPFKAFSEYNLIPSLQELQELSSILISSTGGGGGGHGIDALSSILPSSTFAQGFSLPPSLLLPPSLKSRHLLYTYTLAFQCIVNIGVRGSEAIRTRVVEAGALEVVVHVLERYLGEIERKRVKNQVDWNKAEQARLAQEQLLQIQAMSEGAGDGREGMILEQEEEEEEDYEVSSRTNSSNIVIIDSSPLIDSTQASRPRLTRINIVAASSSAGVEALAPPSRVQTPDTVLSNDDASLTGDDNGSSSGQETEEVTMSIVTTSNTSSSSSPAAVEETASRLSIKAEGSRGSVGSTVTDDNGDVSMSGPSSPVEERSEAEAEVEASGSGQEEHREPTPRSTVQPNLLPAPTPIHRTPRAADSRVPRHRRTPAGPPLPVSHNAFETSTSPQPSTSPTESPVEGQLYFRDEDVLLALQLLAYLSKYPHVREVFHCPSTSSSSPNSSSSSAFRDSDDAEEAPSSQPFSRLSRSINIFSLVELFTHRPSSDDPFTPRLSNEVQYWACTIMRNACRKDELRGGIRQCANMNCGKWEQYAREFAKCRRCRRAKYCSKACQSASWGNGHKFWCHKQSSEERQSTRTTHSHNNRRSTTTSTTTPPTTRNDQAGVDSTGIETPTNASPLLGAVVPPSTTGRRRHRRTTTTDPHEVEEDDEDLPIAHPHPHPHRATPTTTGTLTRNRSGTVTQHLLVQPTPLLPGMEGQVEGGMMPVTIDEDQIAREMMSMGDQEGVRIQDT